MRLWFPTQYSRQYANKTPLLNTDVIKLLHKTPHFNIRPFIIICRSIRDNLTPTFSVITRFYTHSPSLHQTFILDTKLGDNNWK